MALPLAVLMASLMTFGNLGEHSELLALKSSGISLQKIMASLIVFMVVVSVLAFYFSNNVIPYSNLKMRALLYDIRKKKPSLKISEGIFYDGIEGYSIKVSKKENSGLLHDILIYEHSKRGENTKVIVADSGYMQMTSGKEQLVLKLYNGHSYTEMEDNSRGKGSYYPHRRDNFREQTLYIDLEGFGLNRTDETLFKDHYQMMSLSQLDSSREALITKRDQQSREFKSLLFENHFFKWEKSLHREEGDTSQIKSFNLDSVFDRLSYHDKIQTVNRALSYARLTKSTIDNESRKIFQKNEVIWRHEIVWHKKFTLSFACLIFFFIGAPLGAIIRKGGLGMPLIVSVLFFVMYYVITITGQKFVEEGVWESSLGMWLPSFILLPLGIFLTYKATNDSVILNINAYFNVWKRMRMFFRKKKRKEAFNEELSGQ